MNISEQNNKTNYTLSSGSGSRKDVLNYNQADYDNYQSWSNVRRGNIEVSAIDENNQVNTNKFPYHRLQPLSAPHMSFGDTSLSWAPVNSAIAKPVDNFMNNVKKN